MESKNNKTIFQNLGRIFDITPNTLKPTSEPIAFDKESEKGLLASASKEDVDLFKLQAKQQTLLTSQFLRLVGDQKEKTLGYESSRLQQYFDYETMDGYPVISAALDLLCEESTTIGQNGKMLNVFSSSKTIKRELERLFEKVIDINIALPPWARNLCKYGDNFVYLIMEEDRGIVGTRQLPNIEIDRVEDEIDGKIRVKFINKQRRSEEYNTWQVAHFRLLGDDRRMPYGMSMLDKVRRTYKMLSMAEDAMLVYRITRAAERRVVKVNVGNAPVEDVPMLIQAAAAQFHGKSPLIDRQTGDINFKYSIATNDSDIFIAVRTDNATNPIETLQGACLALNTKIDLLDGRSLTLSDIINEYESGKQLWTYSINPTTGEVVPGKITNAAITRKNTDVLKITLDNGETITCTPDHKFPTRINGIKQAKDLEINESLWSFNKDFKKIRDGRAKYEMIYNHKNNKFEYTHRLVANYFKNINKEKYFIYNEELSATTKNTIHHLNFNRYNNNPDNLVFMNNKDHYDYHSKNFSKFSWLGGLKTKEKFDNNSEFRNEVKFKLGKIITEYYNNRSEVQKDEHNKAISDGIKKHFEEASDEWRSNRRMISKNNVSIAHKRNKIRLDSDKEFRDFKVKQIQDGLKKVMNTPEYQEKISKNRKELWKNDGFREKVFKVNQKVKYSDKLFNIFIDSLKNNDFQCKKTISKLNINEEFMNEFVSINSEIRSSLFKYEFKKQHLVKMVRNLGYLSFKDLRDKTKFYNHKIVSIEFLPNKMDTGTITVDGFEEFHNYHNFALSCGVFTQNSNLNDIADISYLRSNLFTGLGIPKSFLSFSSDDPNEKGGANLSMLDIRFSRKINRVQQALISELNKIAIVHLYTLGGEYAKNIDNFKLTLANPSTQAEMLKIEELSAKLDVYAKAVTAIDGIKPMSQAEAMIKILGKSHDEVIETLQDQMVETKVGAEIVSGDQLLKNSKMFNKLIKYYNAGIITNPNSQETETENQGGDNNEVSDAPTLDDIPSDTLKENKSLLYENQQMIKDLEKMMEDVSIFQNKIKNK